jgi:hypothetical protein
MPIPIHGVPIATEKKTTNLAQGRFSRRFALSKPVFEGLIRELALKSGNRELGARGIASPLPKALNFLDFHGLPDRLAWKIVVFFSVAIGTPIRA